MILKHWLITSALAVAAIPAGAELYRWVDASGTVHYSDTPQEGAQKIVLKPTNVIRSRRSVAPNNASGSSGGETPGAEPGELGLPIPYTDVIVRSPSPDETLWNLGGTLVVQVQIKPALQVGHGVVLFYDGRQVNNEAVASTSITIDNVYRGQHTVRAAVKDQEGNTVFNGESVTFFVQQSTGS